MTLITGFTYNQKSFIVCDLRLTKSKDKNRNQYDRTLKFISLKNKIGIFPSGDVSFWRETIPKLNDVVDLVTYNNIIEIDEPFWQELSIAGGKYTGKISRAICFIISPELQKHRLIKITIKPGEGAIIEEFIDKKTVTIGSGAYIPDINTKLDAIYDRTDKFYEGDLYCIASSFRTEILNQIQKNGSSTFKKLGISPIMILSILYNDYFCICGEEGRGGDYSTSNIYTYKYEFSKEDGEKVSLKNLNNGNEFQIIGLNELDILVDQDEIFDPAKLTEKFDPSEYYQDKKYVFVLEQAVFPKMIGDMKNHIIRFIDKIDFITEHRFCKKIELKRHSLEDIEDKEFSNYQNNDKVFFSFDVSEVEQKFLEELSEEKLFDHKWLSKFIPNYINVYKNT